MKTQTEGAAMKPVTPKTELPPSTQLRKAVFGGASMKMKRYFQMLKQKSPLAILALASAMLILTAAPASIAATPVPGQIVPVGIYHDLDHPFGLAYDPVNNRIWYTRGDTGDGLVHSLKPFKSFTAAELAALPDIGGEKQISPLAGENDAAGTTAVAGSGGSGAGAHFSSLAFDAATGQLVAQNGGGASLKSFDPFTGANLNFNYRPGSATLSFSDGLDVEGTRVWYSPDVGPIYLNGVLKMSNNDSSKTFLPGWSGLGGANSAGWSGCEQVGSTLFAVAVQSGSDAGRSRTLVRFDAATAELLGFDPDGDDRAARWEDLAYDGRYLYAADLRGNANGNQNRGDIYVFEVTGGLVRPPAPYGLTAQWGGNVVPGLFNAVLAWRHPGEHLDGSNTDGVDKFRVYRRRLLPDIDCHLRLFYIIPYPFCNIDPHYEQVGPDVPANKLGAVLENLEDLVDVFDGWQFAVRAVNSDDQESELSNPVVVLPFQTGSLRPPQPVLFVPGFNGDSNTWQGATEKLHALYSWSEGQVSNTSSGATLISPGDFYRFTFPDRLGDIRIQGEQIGELLNAILQPPQKAILVGHSQGGLSSRAYLQFVQNGQPNRVSRLVTYGTPHRGTDLPIIFTNFLNNASSQIGNFAELNLPITLPYFGHFDVHFDPLAVLKDSVQGWISRKVLILGSVSAGDVQPSSTFMSDLSDFVQYPLPNPETAGISYVSLQGQLSLLTGAIVDAADVLLPPAIPLANEIDLAFRNRDVLFTIDEQNLGMVANLNFASSKVQVFQRDPVFHALAPDIITEGGDYIAVLLGLGYPVLSIQVHSPVTVAVIDPAGHFITPDIMNIPGATYTMSGGVEIPMPLTGDYQIIPLPDPNADPTSTFTIVASFDGHTTVVAQNQAIQDIPTNGYSVAVSPVAPRADLSITKTASPDMVRPSFNIVYTIAVTNNGPDDAALVTLTDNLPPDVSFVSCSSTGGGVCSGSGNTRVVTFSSLAAGASATINFVAAVNCPTAGATLISNTATVSSATSDPDLSNNSASATATVVIDNKCPKTQGFWKNNPSAWPVSSLPLGSQSYSKAELVTILRTPVGTGKMADASLILADQLIAAKLNIAKGSNPSPVCATIADADSLLSSFAGKLRFGVKSSSAIGQAMVSDANALDRYNQGVLTPGCLP